MPMKCMSGVAEGLFAIERLKRANPITHVDPAKVAEGLFAIERLKQIVIL